MSEDQVRADFDRARLRAFMHDLLALIQRRPNNLIPYHEIRTRFMPESESYRGLQTVPIEKIVGSMDRYRDFDRAFLPRQRHTARRWQNVDRLYYKDVLLPPVQLYKVGDIYFVKDGNHRISVARDKGASFIDAEVIEAHIRVPLYASMSAEELLLQAEYAEFLRRTNLDRLRPHHDIRPTSLGRYDVIWDQIRQRQHWLSEMRGEPVSTEEAVTDWYDHLYLPIVETARERGIVDEFPDHTGADIYLWVMAHRDELAQREGHEVDPIESTVHYAEEVAARHDRIANLRRNLGLMASIGRVLARRARRRLKAKPATPRPAPPPVTTEEQPESAPAAAERPGP